MKIINSIFVRFFKFALLYMFLGASVRSEVIYQDDFESGVINTQWLTGARRVSIVPTTNANNEETLAIQFAFQAASAGDDSFSELRFDLGARYSQVGISFDLYIPNNYVHRNESPSNNKFFRLWPVDYGDNEKIGASMLNDNGGASSLGIDYSKQSNWGISTGVDGVNSGFIQNSDKGKWMTVKINILKAQNGQNGLIQILKNGQIFVQRTPNNEYSSIDGYQFGYILGWANSGFSEETRILLDNIQFSDSIGTTPNSAQSVIVN